MDHLQYKALERHAWKRACDAFSVDQTVDFLALYRREIDISWDCFAKAEPLKYCFGVDALSE